MPPTEPGPWDGVAPQLRAMFHKAGLAPADYDALDVVTRMGLALIWPIIEKGHYEGAIPLIAANEGIPSRSRERLLEWMRVAIIVRDEWSRMSSHHPPADHPSPRELKDHRIVPKLRHHRWRGWTEIANKPLIAMPVASLPRYGVGEDRNDSFEFIGNAQIAMGPRTFDEWEAIAVRNVGRRSMEWRVKGKTKGFLGIGARPHVLELIEEFACERILDVQLMQRAHELLRAPILAVSIPVRGIMWARPAPATGCEMELLAQSRDAFVQAPNSLEPITPLVFAIQQGRVTGVITGGADPERFLAEGIEPIRGFPWPASPLDQ